MGHAEREEVDRVAEAHRRVLGMLYRNGVRNPHDADDIAQNVMERMVRHYAGLPDEQWFRLVATVTAGEQARFYQRRWVDVVPIDSAEAAALATAADSVERRVVDRAELRAALATLGAMSTKNAEALLRFAGGEPYAEQADELGVAEGTLQVRASRARARLRERGRWTVVVPGGSLLHRLGRIAVHRAAVAVTTGGVAAAAFLAPLPPPSHDADGLGATPGYSRLAAAAVELSAIVSVHPRMGGAVAAAPRSEPAARAPQPAGVPAANRMHTVASAQVGRPATVAAGVSVQRDGDPRSPLEQIEDCLARGPSLDPHRAGCPT